MPQAFSGRESWYRSTLLSLSPNSTISTAKLIYSYNHVIQGFSASLTPAQLEALKNAPGYVSSVRDRTVKLDTTHSFEFIGLNSHTGAWPVSNFGEDVIIGVIDTGVWPESESFNDDGMTDVPVKWKGDCESGAEFNSSLCNKKLIGERSFNKGLIAKNPNISISMNSPRDSEGHGTHTSSTAAGTYVQDASYFGYANGAARRMAPGARVAMTRDAYFINCCRNLRAHTSSTAAGTYVQDASYFGYANRTARGMAPGARVAMYNVIWPQGAYMTDIIVAIDQAITGSVDVLSMSFGMDNLQLYEDPIAIATFAAIEKNIFVSTSAGNAGPGLGTLHNGIPWVLTVAAGTLDRSFGASLSFRSDVFVNSVIVCQDPGREDSLSYQFDNNQFAGNVAGVFITNSTQLDIFIQSPFPSIFLEQKDGDAVVRYIKTNKNPKARIEFIKTFLGSKPSPTVASYTSRGPTFSSPSVLKPDIMAPGDLILAVWPPNIAVSRLNNETMFSNYNLLSGTSMARPHASGITALLKGVHPD
ncbi:hypothetical protein F3Y22_tig00111131pilonHSYRG00013 [Hibiscus syriacus]|uniref:Subtilisin-like protease SBT1.9 n=1 Tax=Hibiscus syriacus TaxID=106335 RepID=A0A6A2YZP3_HIBSY|nr:hypothetical protein F3Y22_tig00111131pilonHSYRG00013 [Hibiscus syriacus]